MLARDKQPVANDEPPVAEAVPNGLSDDVVEQVSAASASGQLMVFQVGLGELPNVVQYLNVSRRSGKLEVDPRLLLAERGVVYFRAGEAYYARLGLARGLVALADMIGFESAEAIFIEDAEVAATNIEMPTRQLILEAVVMADQRRDAPAAAVPGDETLLMPASGSRVVLRPAPAEAIAAAVAVPAAAEESSHRLTVAMVILAAVAVIVNTVWVASELRGSSVRKRQAVEQETIHEQHRQAELLRSRKINQMLQKAVDAYTENRLDAAADGVAAVLVAEPGNQAAITLQERVVNARSLIELVPLRAQAETQARQVDSLLDQPQFASQAKSVLALQDNARAWFEQKAYRDAVSGYRQFGVAAAELVELKSRHDQALAAQNLIPAMKGGGERLDAPAHAPEVWSRALALEKQGDAHFMAGDYVAASSSWQQAVEQFEQAAGHARLLQELREAMAAFESGLADRDREVLDSDGGQAWQDLEVWPLQARQAQDAGDLKLAVESWRMAAAKLDEAWKVALKNRQRRLFDEWLAKGRMALGQGDWEVAVASLGQAVGLTGYEDHAEAAKLFEQARYNLLASRAATFRQAEEWQQVKNAASEILKLRPDDPEAGRLLAEAEDKLWPRLTLEVVADGKPAPQAKVLVAGAPFELEGKFSYRLEKAGDYTFEVSLPRRGEIYYETATFRYQASEPGGRTVRVEVNVLGQPVVGQGWTVPGLGLSLAPVPAGTFLMGGTVRPEERPQRQVTLATSFWMAATETTNRQYRQFIEESGYDGRQDGMVGGGYLAHFASASDIPAGDNYPISYVSWRNAEAFCRWLTSRERGAERLPDGYVYRLPTEAEWEYACRAGSEGDFAGDISLMAWHGNRSPNNAEVARLRPNAWRLYDMHGNVWEFCHDWYAPYPATDSIDPKGPPAGNFKVVRGGSWKNSAEMCRSSYRTHVAASETRGNFGFRIVLAPPVN